MTLMNAELYDALLEAGAHEDKARAAAQSVAQHDTRLDTIEARLTAIEGRLTAVEGRLTMLMWVVGINLALTLAAFGVVIQLLTRSP